MQGLTWASLKKNPSLIPLFAFVGVGVVGAVAYTIRVMVKSPEVKFVPKNDAEPWNEYRNKKYKFYAPELKGQEVACPAPEY